MTGSGPDSTSNPTSGVLPPVTAAAPPHAAAEAAPCAKVLAQLPINIGKLNQRVVHTKPDSPYVVAWGNPAIVLACGVNRPAALHPGSSEQVFNAGDIAGPYYMVSSAADANVYTVIDRQPYISITIPAKYPAGTLLPTLIGAIGKALPPVCSTDPATADPSKLCTRRTT